MDVQWRKNGGNVIHCEGKSKHRGTETRRGFFKFSEDTENLKNSVALWFYIRMVIMWRAVLHDVKSEPYI